MLLRGHYITVSIDIGDGSSFSSSFCLFTCVWECDVSSVCSVCPLLAAFFAAAYRFSPFYLSTLANVITVPTLS